MPARPHTSTTHRRGLRAALTLAAATGVLLAAAPGASAHVRVVPDTTAAGSFAELTFRVPTESETAGTVGLRVELPTDTPLTSVRTRPVPGWTAVVERGALPAPVDRDGATLTEAPLAVVWTADPGTEVGPGEYQTFAISVGPLPEAGTEVLLPATQTYSDGEVVAWADEPLPDGEEPELPAPVLVTTEPGGTGAHVAPASDAAASQDGSDDGSPAGADDAGDEGSSDVAAQSSAASPARDTGARWLGAGGLALGAAAVVVAGVRGRGAATRA